MYKKKAPYLISLLLLILMFFKVSAVHVYTHEDTSTDQIENCKICDSAIENQDIEHLSTASVTIDANPQLFSTPPKIAYVPLSITTSLAHLRLFSRPPPALGS
ncbi:hypothetical protein [Maribacter sp.]